MGFSLESNKILLVDDRSDNLFTLEHVLINLPAQLLKAQSGDEALALTLSHKFALAILDVQMPDMDGYELAQILRADPNTKDIPIIFLSAVYSDEFHVFKGYQSGGIDFITKPFKPEILVNKVKLFLEQRDLQRRTEQALVAEQQARIQLEEALENLKVAQSELVSKEKLASLGQLTAGIAHEINNSTNFTYAGAQALKINFTKLFEVLYPNTPPRQTEDIEIAEDIKGLIEDILLGAKRTAEVVKGLRNYSRTVKGEKTLANLQDHLDFTLVLLRHKLTDQIEIKKNYQEGFPSVYCNTGTINQIFTNLINNAIDALTEGGIIELSTQQTGDNTVTITIADNGPGIALEDQEKIFAPFFTKKAAGKGTGLGLSISAELIKANYGSLQLQSQPRQGASFIITLPIMPPDYQP